MLGTVMFFNIYILISIFFYQLLDISGNPIWIPGNPKEKNTDLWYVGNTIGNQVARIKLK